MCRIVQSVAKLPAVARHNTAWGNSKGCHDCVRKEVPVAPGSNDTRPTFTCYSRHSPEHCKVKERLYVHAICSWEKEAVLKGLKLWFLDLENPMLTNASAIAAAGLPCGDRQNVAYMNVVP